MAIAKGKQRYSLTLTKETVDRFQGLCKKLGLPPSTMSNLCDDAISNVSDTFQFALEKGTMDLSDLFKVMGKQLELLEEDKKEKKHGGQKRN